MNLKKTILGISILLSVHTLAHAQDLLASQAPLDAQMSAVDSVALRRLLLNEHAEFPSQNLYPEWGRGNIHYASKEMPDSFCISLAGFCMPTENVKVNDIFGYRPRRRRMHYGLDIKVQIGDTIRAAFDGRVRIVANQGRRVGYGKYVVVRHDNGLETVYGHLSKQIVKPDEFVKAGQPIGLGGNTGRSTGPHLHFETIFMGQALNPALMFDFENQDVTGDSYTFIKKKSPNLKSGIVGDGETRYHKVRSGDSLARIAKRYGVPLNQLYKLNSLTSRSVLRPGQMVRYM